MAALGRVFFSLLLACSAPTRADEIHVAVAANFAAPMAKIAAAFSADTGHTLRIAYGATGAFYAQIKNGAPFEVLLAADAATPERLEREGWAVPGSRAVYAIGTLVLWSPLSGQPPDLTTVLQRGAFRHLALANPKLAPYGAAAQQVLHKLGVLETLRSKLVMGENIAQTYQFVVSGNAQLGFLALAQIPPATGTLWRIPAHLYDPLRQAAVLLNKGKEHRAARQLLNYLHGTQAQTIISNYGYDLEK